MAPHPKLNAHMLEALPLSGSGLDTTKSSGFSLTGLGARMRPMSVRYDIREEGFGWSVYDVWTGEAVVIALNPQTDMDIQDADDLADKLNYLAAHGQRQVFQ